LPEVAIDADLHAGLQDADAEVAATGLTDVLVDRVDWRGVLSPARDDRVQLLAAGRPLLAADSLASAATRLGPILAEMKTRYRSLVIHGGSATNPLAGALAQAADLVYLVVRLGQTPRKVARAAKRKLERSGAMVHGVVVVANM
jgi:Mrp family chromosome partitioning ATPase